jgi:hypothetical protein
LEWRVRKVNLNTEQLIIHLFPLSPIISVEAGNKAQSYNIALSSPWNENARIRRHKNRKRIILLLFFILFSTSFFVQRKNIFFVESDCVRMNLKRGEIKYSQGTFLILISSFFLFIIFLIDYIFLVRGKFCILFYEWILWQQRT